MKTFINKIKPHTFFLLAAITFGIVYNIICPPLQAPDEYDHFRRAYHLSEGHFLPEKKDNRLGGDIPVSFKEFITPYRKSATNLKYTLDRSVFINSFKVPFNNSEKEFNDFPNTSFYSLISYLPQVIAMTVVKQINISVATLFYSGRFFMFFVWIIIVWRLIKIIPIYKWLFTLIALLPMNIYISNSYSADIVTNLLSFILIAFVLKYALDENKFNTRRLFFLIFIAVLLALSKVVYVGLVLSFFIIPINKFKNKLHFAFCSFMILACSFIVANMWSQVIMHYYTPYHLYNPAFRDLSCISSCGNYPEQKKHILTHGFYFLKVLYHTLYDHPYTYMVSYIGAFGLYDIPVPVWLMNLSYIVIIIVASMEKSIKLLTLFQKIILVCSASFSFFLLVLSQHLTWDCVGEGVVDLLQGRYLIPIFPLLFMFFNGFLTRIKIPVQILIIPLVFILSYVSIKLIYARYFEDSFIFKQEFTCGAEEVTKDGFFKTSDSTVLLIGLDSRNDSVSRTGKYSILLSAKSPYSFTFHFKNLCKGDLIEMSAWQKGEGAQMVITGKGKKCEEFYMNFWDIRYKGTDGWNRMDYAFTMTKDCGPKDSVVAAFFMWNANKNTQTYIDDFKFSIKKFNNNYLDSHTYVSTE